jgi:hypothetical protein
VYRKEKEVKSNDKFEKDLSLGERAENWLRFKFLPKWFRRVIKIPGNFKPYDLIATKKDGTTVTFEVKRESYNFYHSSNNICIEYEYNGRASGIKYTSAIVWAHIFYDNEVSGWFMLLADTEKLKEWILEKADEIKNSEYSGDNNKSKSFVIPIKLLRESRFKIIELPQNDIDLQG